MKQSFNAARNLRARRINDSNQALKIKLALNMTRSNGNHPQAARAQLVGFPRNVLLVSNLEGDSSILQTTSRRAHSKHLLKRPLDVCYRHFIESLEANRHPLPFGRKRRLFQPGALVPWILRQPEFFRANHDSCLRRLPHGLEPRARLRVCLQLGVVANTRRPHHVHKRRDLRPEWLLHRAPMQRHLALHIIPRPRHRQRRPRLRRVNRRDGHLILRQRPRLVHANHGRAPERLDGRK
mmetsp:Transcript_21659/g.53441  ORF Transcript_21659/g.53441 Transcript_21659/m.53441 type:complete len:238 (-) Transcript_21659:393-1106(-)